MKFPGCIIIICGCSKFAAGDINSDSSHTIKPINENLAFYYDY